jgi:hypothetical protein
MNSHNGNMARTMLKIIQCFDKHYTCHIQDLVLAGGGGSEGLIYR